MSVIACSAWVKRGLAKEHPDKVELTGEELKQLIEETSANLKDLEGSGEDSEELEDAEEISEPTQPVAADEKKKPEADDDDELAKYNLDNYDEENEGNLSVFAANKEDPYITSLDQDDEEVEDFTVQPSENLVVIGRTEDALSHIEVYVYNEEEEDFFQHHDILLSSFPLCIEWLDYDPGSESAGNLLAVGTMNPQIDIWDLDVVDSVEPVVTLGEKLKAKKKKAKAQEVAGHTKEVMGLSWNTLQRNMLASSSADCTVRIWDLATCASLRSFNHHRDKVQTVRWNLASAPVMLSGAFDGNVVVFDTRSPQTVSRYDFGSSIESCVWDPHQPARFFASCENGQIYCGDTRHPGRPSFSMHVGRSAVAAVGLSMHASGCLVAASDQTLTVWDVSGAAPALVATRELPAVGSLYTLTFCPELPFTVAAAGHRGGVHIVDLAESSAVQKRFYERLSTAVPPVHKELLSQSGPERETMEDIMDEDDEEEDDEDDGDGNEPGAESVPLEEEEEEEGEGPQDDDMVVEELEQMTLKKTASAAGAHAPKSDKKKKKKKSKSKGK